jgi:hypothetical protein
MNINIKVTNKRATVIGAPVIVCVNSGYTVQFTFDEEWDGLKFKTARFVYVKDGAVRHTDVPFDGDTAEVPMLTNIKEVLVGVFSGNLRTTVPARIPCELSIRCGSGEPQDPTPSQYDRIMELLNAVDSPGACANALKGQASGSTISLSDVSPVRHLLKVKVTAPEGVALPALKTSGKNLADPALLVSAGGKVQDDGSIKFDPISTDHPVFYRGNGSTDRVTLSFDVQTAYDLSQEYGQRFRVFYQGSTQAVPLGSVISVGNFSHYSITTGAGRIVDRIELDYGNTKNPTWIKNLQIELGTKETDFEPFCGGTYTPSADGSVPFVESISPAMLLRTETEGATIEAEYNRDLNKAYNELLQRVAAIPVASVDE